MKNNTETTAHGAGDGAENVARKWTVLSLGAGVQSSTLALMAARSELLDIQIDFAIFADTQDEPQGVYSWLDWLESQLPFPVYRVSKGRLSSETLKMRVTADGRPYSRTNVPFFTRNADGSLGRITHRSCTADFKIRPILRELRKRCGIKRGQKTPTVTSLIGISFDEQQRMKDSRDPWVVNRWPLVELRMRRADCLEWMRRNGYPMPPRSSCVFCPFHRNDEWRRLKNEEPKEFARAVEFEKQLQANKTRGSLLDSVPFLHRSCIPLDQIDFRSSADRGQMEFGFMEECEGMCGN